MIAGVVSIGTNSTRALGARIGGKPEILLTRSTGTRIGEGLRESGVLQREAMERTLEAAREHVHALREFTSEPLHTIATSALRRAANAGEFGERVSALTGSPLEIISGEEEARRSYMGAISGTNGLGPYGVFDTGGGSSEYAAGWNLLPDASLSCEIGAVRLTEMLPELRGAGTLPGRESVESARAIVRNALRPVRSIERVRTLLVAGGTATTAVALVAGERRRFEYAPLFQADVQALLATLLSSDLEARKAMPGMNAQRADILPAGLIIVQEFLAMTGHVRAVVTTNDLLLGTLLLPRQ